MELNEDKWPDYRQTSREGVICDGFSVLAAKALQKPPHTMSQVLITTGEYNDK